MDVSNLPRATVNLLATAAIGLCVWFMDGWTTDNQHRWEVATAQLQSIELTMQKLDLEIQQLHNTTLSYEQFVDERDNLMGESHAEHEKMWEAIRKNQTDLAILKGGN